MAAPSRVLFKNSDLTGKVTQRRYAKGLIGLGGLARQGEWPRPAVGKLLPLVIHLALQGVKLLLARHRRASAPVFARLLVHLNISCASDRLRAS